MKNHFGVKWFYIEPPEEPFWCQMVLCNPLKKPLMMPKWLFIEPFKEPLEGS